MPARTASFVQPLESRVLFTVIPFIVDRDPPVVLIGDLNGDGKGDLVSAKIITDRDTGRSKGFGITVELGEGDGTFRKRGDGRGSVDMTTEEFAAMCIGDVDQDGDLDICLAAREPQTGKANGLAMIDVDKEGALGELRYLDVIDPLAGKIVVLDVAAGDVNGDRIVDVVQIISPRDPASGQAAGTPGVRVLWGLGGNIDVSKLPVSSPVFELPVGTDCIFTGDVDGDGVDEVVAAGKKIENPPRLPVPSSAIITTIAFSPGGDAKVAQQKNPIYEAETKTGTNALFQGRMIGVADLDGDGRADLVGDADGALRSAIWDSRSQIWDSRSQIWDSRSQVWNALRTTPPMAVGDLDGDGRADFYLSSKLDGLYLTGFTIDSPDHKRLQIDWTAHVDIVGDPDTGDPAADDLLRLMQLMAEKENGGDALAIILKQDRFAAFFHS